MNPYISGSSHFCPCGLFTKMKISQHLLGVVRDFKFFWREKVWPDILRLAISADRPAESAKSAIFWKEYQKLWKTWPQIKILLNGRKWPKIFKKNLCESFNIIFFKRKFFFAKKLPNFKNIGFGQKLTYFWPISINYLQILILLWEIDNFCQKLFWYVFKHYCFQK